MGEQPAQHLTVRMSGQVIARDELEQRLRVAITHLDRSGSSSIETAAVRSDLLHRYSAAPAAPLERQPGVRGRVVFFVKRSIRRLTAWYVEPRWTAQREFNTETARFSAEATDAIRILQLEIEELRLMNDRLLRRLHATERVISATAPPAPRKSPVQG